MWMIWNSAWESCYSPHVIYSIINSYHYGLVDVFLRWVISQYYLTYFVAQNVPFWPLGAISVGFGSLCYIPIMWVFILFVLFWALSYFWHYKIYQAFICFLVYFLPPDLESATSPRGPGSSPPIHTFFFLNTIRNDSLGVIWCFPFSVLI